MKKAKILATRKCIICGRYFFSKPFAYRQIICSRKQCKKIRRKSNFQNWKKRNPDYYKTETEEDFSGYWQVIREIYRKKNPDRIKRWRMQNKNKWKNYMKEYMREYRSNHKSKESSVSN